ncbi:EAL domain-containing protein [Baekduia sp. Peel2402]|uniref:EAL domain-containing protein n=1 Tax=Baekduia sp. Peel2402 TaxID=3458296 RepID=UPI00403E3F4C
MSSVYDPQRLGALAASELMDAAREETFDRLTRLASRMLRVPCSVMTLVDGDRQFFLSEDGMRPELAATRETPLSHSFCKHVVDRSAPLVVTDAREDALVADNLATRDLDVIAYCGVPLRLDDGHVIGAFCAIEPDPREWSAGDVELLSDLAALATEAITLREGRSERRFTHAAPPALAPASASVPVLDPRLETLAAALPAAIAEGAIEIGYTPLVHLASGDTWGFAARAAWNGLDHDELLALAHHDGVVVALGEHVLDRACRDLGPHDTGLVVDATATQLASPGFAERVVATLAAHGIAPRALVLAVDERALVGAGARDAHRSGVEDLRELGVAVGLDGAGTGSVTLSELAALPIDLVLLAPELAQAAHARTAAASLGAAQALALGAIGGGIADDQDVARLAQLGCVTGHGPHFGALIGPHAVGLRLLSPPR